LKGTAKREELPSVEYIYGLLNDVVSFIKCAACNEMVSNRRRRGNVAEQISL